MHHLFGGRGILACRWEQESLLLMLNSHEIYRGQRGEIAGQYLGDKFSINDLHKSDYFAPLSYWYLRKGMTGLIHDSVLIYEHHACYINTFSIKSCLGDGGLYLNAEEGSNSERCDAIFLLGHRPSVLWNIYECSHCQCAAGQITGCWDSDITP